MLVKSRRRPARGFTLVELTATMAVLAILAGLALPSFRSFVANQRIRNLSFDLMASLTLARSEAVTRSRDVALTRASAGGWSGGWKVVEGVNIIQNRETVKNLEISDSADLDAITYGKDGRAVTQSTRFTIKPSGEMSGASARCISIGLSGLPSSSIGACS
jgi:type IV fimbrial biogenesis protein FimT